jgi:hypothetical protein
MGKRLTFSVALLLVFTSGALAQEPKNFLMCKGSCVMSGGQPGVRLFRCVVSVGGAVVCYDLHQCETKCLRNK